MMHSQQLMHFHFNHYQIYTKLHSQAIAWLQAMVLSPFTIPTNLHKNPKLSIKTYSVYIFPIVNDNDNIHYRYEPQRVSARRFQPKQKPQIIIASLDALHKIYR